MSRRFSKGILGRGRDVVLDPDFPHYNNLKMAYFFRDRRPAYDLVRGTLATPTSSPGIARAPGQGYVGDFTNSGARYDTGFDPSDSSYSMLVYFRTTTSGDTYGGPMEHGERGQLASEFNALYFDDGAWDSLSTGTLSDNEWYGIGWTVNDGTSMELYVNGDMTDSTYSLFTLVNPTGNIILGYNTIDSHNWDGYIACALYWDTEIPFYEGGNKLFRSLSLDPFQVLRRTPKWRPIIIPGAAGGEETKTVTDTGTGTESAIAPSVSTTVTETGGGTEVAIGPAVSLPTISETGAGTDASPAVGVQVTATDTGSGAEGALGPAAAVPVTDTGLGTDASPVLSASLTITETGTGTDASPVISVALSIPDTGSAVEAISKLTAVLKTVTDTGTGTEAVTVSGTFTITETGTGTDASPTVLAAVSVTETGTGTDVVSVLTEILKTVTDTGTGTDASPTVTATISVSETGTGTDAPAISVLFSLPDTGTGSDSPTVSVSIPVTDTITGTDLATVLGQLISVLDTGTGTDTVALISALLQIAETGTGVDTANAFGPPSLGTVQYVKVKSGLDYSLTSGLDYKLSDGADETLVKED